jgi:hypothetical protein
MNEQEIKKTENILNMCVDLDVFFSSAMENMAILKAYSETNEDIRKCDEDVKKLISDSIRLLEQQLFIEVSKIFESAETGKHQNVSLNRLRILLENEEENGNGSVRIVIDALNELCDYYSNTGMSEMRNKILAHHDKIELDKKQMKVVPYPMIEKLVLEGERINRAAFMALLGIERSAYDYNEMIRRYKNAIQTMIC